jgi:hypothetical protein
VALESNSGVISRLVSYSVEELEKSEDEEAMAREVYADGVVATGLRKEMDARCIDAGLNKG